MQTNSISNISTNSITENQTVQETKSSAVKSARDIFEKKATDNAAKQQILVKAKKIVVPEVKGEEQKTQTSPTVQNRVSPFAHLPPPPEALPPLPPEPSMLGKALTTVLTLAGYLNRTQPLPPFPYLETKEIEASRDPNVEVLDQFLRERKEKYNLMIRAIMDFENNAEAASHVANLSFNLTVEEIKQQIQEIKKRQFTSKPSVPKEIDPQLQAKLAHRRELNGETR